MTYKNAVHKSQKPVKGRDVGSREQNAAALDMHVKQEKDAVSLDVVKAELHAVLKLAIVARLGRFVVQVHVS